MNIIIEFEIPIREEKFLHHLRNIKKSCPVLRHYVSEVTDDSYCLKDQDGNAVCEFNFFVLPEKQAVQFQNFRGQLKNEVEKMLRFNLPENINEKCWVYDKEENIRLYYDLVEFFLVEKQNAYKIGTDYEKIIAIESYRVPREVKMSQKVAVDN